MEKPTRAHSVYDCLSAVRTFHCEFYWFYPKQTLTTFNWNIVQASLDLLFLTIGILNMPCHVSLGVSFNQSFSFHESW